jgi:hypothetical protein
MKNLFIILVFFSFNNVFSNQIKNMENESIILEKKLTEHENTLAPVCCTQVASTGTPKTKDYVRVSITKCVEEGANANLSYHQACMWAAGAAGTALNNIVQNMEHTLTVD